METRNSIEDHHAAWDYCAWCGKDLPYVHIRVGERQYCITCGQSLYGRLPQAQRGNATQADGRRNRERTI